MAKTYTLEDSYQASKKQLAGSGITVSRTYNPGTPTTADQPTRPKRSSSRKTKRSKESDTPQYKLTPGGERIARQIASFNPEPILILGPAGTGKSLLIRHIAQQLGIDFVAVNAHQGLDISQLVGLWRPVQTESGITIEWEDGSLTRSVKTGGLFLFEEITRAPQELLSRLFGLLDTDGRYWPLPEAGIDGVEVHPNFWFVATGNPVGSGYHTASLDRALEDRFQAIYEIKEPLAPERDVLADLVGGDVADGLDRFATDARRNESTYVSTRNLIQAARLVQRGTHPVEAVTLAISRKFRGYQDGLDELARLHLKRTSRNLQLSEYSEVIFPDKHLEAAVRKNLAKPGGPITREALKALGELAVVGKGIENIEGLEAAVNLTRLDLSYNQIGDISPLASLTYLTQLDLRSNAISDISPLVSLARLTRLDLWNNQISDITPIKLRMNLTRLDLGNNQISDITPLASLIYLKELWLGNNQISDITPLTSRTKLTNLDLGNNQIIDASPLASLVKLKELDLGNNQICDVTPLAPLIKLRGLHLGSNQIRDVGPLVSLTKLDRLDLKSNAVSDISLMSALTKLFWLDLQNNLIVDVKPLVSLTDLYELWLKANPLDQEAIDVCVPSLRARSVRVKL